MENGGPYKPFPKERPKPRVIWAQHRGEKKERKLSMKNRVGGEDAKGEKIPRQKKTDRQGPRPSTIKKKEHKPDVTKRKALGTKRTFPGGFQRRGLPGRGTGRGK